MDEIIFEAFDNAYKRYSVIQRYARKFTSHFRAIDDFRGFSNTDIFLIVDEYLITQLSVLIFNKYDVQSEAKKLIYQMMDYSSRQVYFGKSFDEQVDFVELFNSENSTKDDFFGNHIMMQLCAWSSYLEGTDTNLELDSLIDDLGKFYISVGKLFNLSIYREVRILKQKLMLYLLSYNHEKLLNHTDIFDKWKSSLLVQSEVNVVKSAQEQLNELIGLQNVKDEIRTLVNFVRVNILRDQFGLKSTKINLHMVFTGNPGTGKTTVARLLSSILKDLGIVSKGHLVETDRSRLVAGYVGQTALNVKRVVEEAIGGVLFIDEAYSLSRYKSENDFGREAIDTLVKLMEDHRSNLVVIVAGYPAEMKKFVDSNPGLKSRFGRYLHFDDYSSNELIEIYSSLCKNEGLIMSKELKEKIGELVSQAVFKTKYGGNARGVRNLFERSLLNQANRLASSSSPSRDELCLITENDIDM